MRRASSWAWILIFLASLPVVAGEASVIAKQVDALLAPLVEEDLLSGSVLIAHGDRVDVIKGYGPANREYDVACTPETRYRLASMTKSFTALAVLMLAEQERLSVNDTLDKYIADYPRANEITLHHLLTHTSGVVNYSRLEDHYRIWTMPHTLDQVIERFKNEPLRFAPGERFEYSNSGYVLLTYVIEKVSGKSYEEFLDAQVFTPLGMDYTSMDSHTRIIPQRAIGHYNHGEGIIQAPYLDIAYTSGAGGLRSTVRDLYKWDRALYTDRLLSTAMREKMFTSYQSGYGYGWFVREELGRTLIEHRGGINGFLTMIQRFVDDDVVVVTLFNYVSTFARDVNRALAAIALGEDYEPVLIPEGVSVAEDSLRDLPGKYRLADSTLEVTLEQGRLWVTDPDLERSEAIPQGGDRFFLRDGNAMLRFLRGEGGEVERMIVLQSEHIIPCPRLADEPSSPS